MAPRVTIYTRQSKDSKASISRQKTEQTQRAQQQGWDIRAILQDGVSASRFKKGPGRDDWPKLLEMIRQDEVDIVSLWESSRGSRELEEWAAFLTLCRNHGVLIDILTHEREPYDMSNGKDWKSLADDGVDSAYESEKTSKRLRSQAASLAKAGKPNGKLIFGYTRIYDENREFVAQPEKTEEANLIREAAKRFSEGVSLRSIAKDFDARGILSPGGVAGWSSTAVRRLIENRAYLGERWHNGKFAGVAVWPAILDLETFNACAERLKAYKGGADTTALRHFLSGVATCQHGSPMIITKNRDIEYYKSRDYCTQVKKDELEDYVGQEVRERMLKVVKEETSATHKKAVAKAKAEVSRLEKLIADTQALVVGGQLDLIDSLGITKPAQVKLEAARVIANSSPSTDFAIKLRDAGIDWYSMTVEQRQELTRSIITVTVLPVGRVGRWGAPPIEDRVVIENVKSQDELDADAEMYAI